MKKLAALLALALAAFALVACGDDDEGTTTTDTSGGAAAESEKEAGGGEGGSKVVAFEADPDGGLAYTTDEVTAPAGKDTIEFNNPTPIGHDVVIEDEGGKEVARTDVITESEDSAAADLKSGKYTFYCSVPGHREAGMEGTLDVE